MSTRKEGINSNVVLIDPNKVNTNDYLPNPLPKYEDMFISVSLVARRRSRSVIYTEGNVLRSFDNTDSTIVNFIGTNQRDGDINKNKFTTNYYDGSTGNYVTDESFGITSIKVINDSSYIPRVEIQFVDVRGLSFFSNDNSRYRMLFDFPPPIFELTLKGYYGAPLKYLLHLTSYQTSFDDSSANHIISTKFVALTYAPLTDVPFRYAVNFGMMNDKSMGYDPDTEEAPKNTYELIMKLKSLYASINQSVKGSEENKSKLDIENKINEIKDVFNYIENANKLEILKGKNLKFYLTTTNTEINEYGISEFGSLNKFINLISNGESSDYGFYLGFEHYTPFNTSNDIPREYSYVVAKENEDKKALNTLKREIDEYLKKLFIRNKLNVITFKNSNYSVSSNKTINFGRFNYIGINLKDVIIELLNDKTGYENKRNVINDSLVEKVNKMVHTKLGMNPSIKNVFDIILNDVDVFFKEMYNVAQEAESDKNIDERNKIFGNTVKDKSKNKIYPFPLVIRTENNKCTSTETRVAPINQSERAYIPEMKLVLDFIESFTRQSQMSKLFEIKETKKENEVNVWIPLSPLDSKLGSPDISLNSPYYFFANSHYIRENSNFEKEMFHTILKRFIAISQNSNRNVFNNNEKNFRDTKEAFIKLYAKGEAVNLIKSIIDDNALNALKRISDLSSGDSLINELIKHDIDENEESLNLNVAKATEINFNINRNNENFVGFRLEFDDIYLSQNVDNTDEKDPYSEFKAEAKRTFWTNFIGGKVAYVNDYEVTTDNLIYNKDKPEKKLKYEIRFINPNPKQIQDEYNNVYLITKFIDGNYFVDSHGFIINHREKVDLTTNKGLTKIEKPDLNKGFNMASHWAETLRMYFFRKLLNSLNDDDNDILMSLIILSNFGSTLSPFNSGSAFSRGILRSILDLIKSNLNGTIFSNSGIVEVPRFVLLYLGLLSYMLDKETLMNDFNILLETEISGKKFKGYAQYITADLGDIKKYLSNSDKIKLKEHYLNFLENEFEVIKNSVIVLVNKPQKLKDNEKTDDVDYYSLLNPEGETGDLYLSSIIIPLIKRVNMLVFSSLTFSFEEKDSVKNYKKLSSYRENNKETVETYFKQFHETIKKNIPTIKNEIKEETSNLRKISEDNDIINQTYYSFKNINDKWISGVDISSTQSKGYPFISSGSLKDYFVYVDRAMNDIGDTMINGELLVDLFNDHNASVFTVISQLLSNNGFEFFPLQNFMTHSDGSWIDSFKISTSTTPRLSSFFVCMYIGGVSSYLNNPNSEMPDDGILDLTTEELLDFNGGCKDTPKIERTNTNFKYSNVFAFIVRFGQQNQSMFTKIDIDSREYPETNESLQILSRLVDGDSDVQPIPKGQNLYSLYENRAYGAKITSMGNMMIQPTQYFQLENVQLYNGVYLILSVEHNITPNHMLTTFSGTKVLKYPTPRVTSPVAFTDYSDLSMVSAGQYVAMSLSTYINNIKYKSIYTHKISKE